MQSHSQLPTNYVKFAQQKLPAWRPILTPVKVLIYFGVLAIISFIIGALFFVSFSNTVEYQIRYDDQCELNQTCTLSFNIEEEIKGDIHLKYKLTKFYQNHRRWMESKSRDQLAGVYVNFEGMSTCDPIRSVNDSSAAEDWILPCGISAISLFNDTFTIDSDELDFNESGIAWDSDQEYNYQPLSEEYKTGHKWLEGSSLFPGGQINEHFIVWMRAGSLPTIVKKYAICHDCTIPAGQLNVTIENNYPQSLFGGEKYVILYKDSAVKSKNNSLGIIFFFLGALCTLFFLLTILERIISPRKLGDMSMIQEIIIQKDKEFAINTQ